MNVKKFAQDKAKKIKHQKLLKGNKENLCSVDDFKFKQFSVDLHKLSMDHQHPTRNIIKEEISVFLQNQSQNKTFNYEKSVLEVELRKFTKKLDEDGGCVKEFLDAELEEGEECRAQQIRKLIGVLVRKLHREDSVKGKSNHNSSMTSNRSRYNSHVLLNQRVMSPFLREQLEGMEKRLVQLQEENNQYKEFRKIEKQQKEYIRHTLETVYKRQLQEVHQLEETRDFCY